MKVARPPDQEMRDKEGPVCSVQRQTEPVASFVPQKPFHHKAHSPILLLLPFPPHPPNSRPTSERTRLTSDLHYSSSMSFRIKHQVFSFFLLPFSYIFFLFPLRHMPVQPCIWRGSFAPISTCECTGDLCFRHRRWEGLTLYVYTVRSFDNMN